MLYTGVIYKYISPSGKIYIGQTTSEKRRMKEHISKSNNPKSSDYNTPFHRAIRKYGINSFIYSIEQTITAPNKKALKETLDYWEIFYIKLYDCRAPKGYNCTIGGDGVLGFKHSETTKARMKNSHTGVKRSEETKKKMRAWQIGKKLSNETKLKISKAHTGKKRPNTYRKCSAYKNGILVATFESVKQAAKMIGTSQPNISKALSKGCTAAGYYWMYN